LDPSPPALPAPPGPPADPAPPRKSGTLFFLALVLLFAPGLLAQAVSRAGGLAWSEVFVFLLPPIVAAAGSNLRPGALLGLGSVRGRHVVLAALVGAAGFLVANGVMALWIRVLPERVLRTFDVSRVFDVPFREQVAIALIASVLAPLCEEAAFRGYLQRTLALRRSPAVAIGVSAVLFGVLHLDPVRLPALVVLGVVFGWLGWRSGSTWPAVTAHAANNGLASALVLATGLPETPPAEPPLQAVIFTLWLGVAGLVLLLAAYRAATPSPPPPSAAVVLRDAVDPSTRFSLARVPRPLWAAAAIGAVLLLVLVATARARGRQPAPLPPSQSTTSLPTRGSPARNSRSAPGTTSTRPSGPSAPASAGTSTAAPASGSTARTRSGDATRGGGRSGATSTTRSTTPACAAAIASAASAAPPTAAIATHGPTVSARCRYAASASSAARAGSTSPCEAPTPRYWNRSDA
jgi:uncharacterized protein